MRCCCCSSSLVSIAAKALLLVTLGTGIGLIDSWRRPIVLERPKPSLPISDGSKTNPGTKPAQTEPIPTPKPVPAEPTDTVGSAGHEPQPGDPNWKPTPKDKIPEGQITLDEGKALYDKHAKFIDARAKDKYEAGHVAGAMRMDLASFADGPPAILGMIDKSEFIVVYCAGGHCDESDAVANHLSGSGYQNIFVLHDGFPGWNAMKFPAETGEGLQP